MPAKTDKSLRSLRDTSGRLGVYWVREIVAFARLERISLWQGIRFVGFDSKMGTEVEFDGNIYLWRAFFSRNGLLITCGGTCVCVCFFTISE